jgi:hypothetical protein
LVVHEEFARHVFGISVCCVGHKNIELMNCPEKYDDATGSGKSQFAAGKFPAGGEVSAWQNSLPTLQPWRSLKDTGGSPVNVVIKCRERCETQRRLRHCIGLRTPTSHCRFCKCGMGGKAGARFEVRSQDISLMILVRD